MTERQSEPEDVLAPLLGRTFTLYESCWSTGYPGIFEYSASLTLHSEGGRVMADLQASYEVERSGPESQRVQTSVTFTGIGRDGTPRLTLGAPMPWGPTTIKIDPRTGTFNTAGGQLGFEEMRIVALPTDDYSAFEAAALGCLRAICRSWEPGFDIPTVRAERTDWTPDPKKQDRHGFIEGAGKHFIVTDFWRCQSETRIGQMTQYMVRDYAVRGLRPPADLLLSLVQSKKEDGPWSSHIYLGRGHDEDYVPEAIRIFNEWFPRDNAG
jgi:hypothetical protein